MPFILAKTLMRLVGLGLGLAFISGAANAATWTSTSMPWFRLPAGDQAGPLPQTMTIPAQAWGYGARTDRVDVFGRGQPVIMRFNLDVQAGSVGLVLVQTDGATMLNKEVALKPTGLPQDVYVRLRPGLPPSFIVLRNYDAEGQPGSAVVNRVSVVREGDLTNDELAVLVKGGLN